MANVRRLVALMILAALLATGCAAEDRGPGDDAVGPEVIQGRLMRLDDSRQSAIEQDSSNALKRALKMMDDSAPVQQELRSGEHVPIVTAQSLLDGLASDTMTEVEGYLVPVLDASSTPVAAYEVSTGQGTGRPEVGPAYYGPANYNQYRKALSDIEKIIGRAEQDAIVLAPGTAVVAVSGSQMAIRFIGLGGTTATEEDELPSGWQSIDPGVVYVDREAAEAIWAAYGP